MNIVTIPLDQWKGHDPEYKYNERTGPIKYIVLHTTGGTDSRNWLSKWNKQQETDQNNVSIHYLVQRDGAIYRIIDDAKRAWHVGVSKMPDGETDGNGVSIGIEIEHMNEPDYTEPQLNSVAELVYTLMGQYKIPGEHVVSHASVAKPGFGEPHGPRKIDPVNFDWAKFWDRVATFDGKSGEPKSQEPISAPIAQLPYSHLSLTAARPQIDAGKLTEYLVNKHAYKNYTKDDVRLILSYYIKYGTQVGIDYVFAISQMIHETGWLDSWWAARPRRNPAGIGVTGQEIYKDPQDDKNWAKYRPGIWKRGQSFESWDISVQHHIARLLLYAFKDEQMTPEQLQFSQICPDRQRLARIRGVATQWVGFNGVWAVPGRTYAQGIATIANSFIQRSQ